VTRWVLAVLLLAAPARAADITVLTAGAFKPVAAALIPEFEAGTGDKVILRNDTVGALLRRINGGEQFDVVLMTPAGLNELKDKIVPGSARTLAKVGIGVAIKTGTPTPDIGTVAAFKATMLNAPSVAYIDPKSGGSSGIYVARLFQTLGIADAMAPKTVLVNGGLAAEAVADGRAAIVVHQISEIISVPGVTLVGPLPAEIQSETTYAGAIASNSTSRDTALAFLAAITSTSRRCPGNRGSGVSR
jgi:molybdate transport system substrate-binding protein